LSKIVTTDPEILVHKREFGVREEGVFEAMWKKTKWTLSCHFSSLAVVSSLFAQLELTS